MAAAAAFLEQSAALTPDPAHRVRRALDSAQFKVHAGAFDDASALLATARAAALDDAARARADLVRAGISFATDRGADALPLLLAAAERLQPHDAGLARDAYVDALRAALFAGRLASGPGVEQVAEAVLKAGAPEPPRRGDALLHGLAVLFTDGYAQSAPAAHRAVQAFASGTLTVAEALRFSWLAAATAASLWDDARWDVLSRRHLEVVRTTGALSSLPLALNTRCVVQLFTGDLAAAAASADETRAVTEMTGSTMAPYGATCLAALRGREEEAEPLIKSCLDDAALRGEGIGVNVAQWARAVLCNGLGKYAEAAAAAAQAAADPRELGAPKWALAELVEAAVRSGQDRTARAAMERLSALTRASGTDWALGIEASRHALLCTGATADGLHREAIERLGRTLVRVELARAQLLYGEWLRREGRRLDARAQLRTAHEALAAMGVEAFADRARRELLATGETVRKRTVEASRAADRAGGADRRARRRRAHERRDRRDALPQPAHGRVAPPEGLHEARHQQPPPAAAAAARDRAERRHGVTERRSQPWKRDRSPLSQAARSPRLPRSQSGRISLVAARRSCQRSPVDGRPQNQ